MIGRVTIPGGVELSRIVYGMWRVTHDDTSTTHVRAKIEACLAQGVTTIDQAAVYGGYTAEAILGDCLRASPGLRDRLEIVTKCGIVVPTGRHAEARVKHYDTSAAHIAASVDHSLQAMGIDHIDLLLIHRPDPLMDHEATGRALDDAVKSGKVRTAGVSNFRPHDWTLLQSAMATPLATNQIEVSLMRPEPFADGDIAFLQERGIPPMAWSPLGGGALFREGEPGDTLSKIARRDGVDETAVAIGWLLTHPSGILPIMGTNRIERIEAFGDALKVQMDRETWFELYAAALGRDIA